MDQLSHLVWPREISRTTHFPKARGLVRTTRDLSGARGKRGPARCAGPVPNGMPVKSTGHHVQRLHQCI